MYIGIMLFLLAGCGTVSAAEANAVSDPLDGLDLVFEDTFDQGMDRWAPTDPKAWEVLDDEGNPVLHLIGGSQYEPKVRSPKNIAWIKDVSVGDFVLDVRMKQTGREYGHRDLCLFFGKQDAAHFYYVHLATKADDHANSIFLVNGEPRASIAQERTDGTDWGTNIWHNVRIVRLVESGVIEVYFDNMEKPVFRTVDKHFVSGTIGLGSFDDEGMYDNVKLYGKKK